MSTKICLLTDGNLSNGTRLDATRRSFLESIAASGEEAILLKTNDFFSGSTPKTSQSLTIALTALEKHRPDLLLSINAAGLHESVIEWARRHSVPIFCWYWDAVDLFPASMVRASFETQVLLACEGLGERGEVLPFSGAKRPWQSESERRPERGLIFMGTCWPTLIYTQAMSLGLVNKSDGKVYQGAELYSRLLEGKQEWETIAGIPMPYGELFNALASVRRARLLAAFRDEDLHIYGDWDWQVYLWPTAPELLEKCHVRLVSSQQKMGELMRRHRGSVNIFHLQNRMGGPNFRILDSATHGVPILSDYNRGCEAIFPEGEAALYFKDEAEAREKGRRLLNDVTLRDRLSKRASEILHEAHSHEKRIEYFLEKAGRPKASEKSRKPVTVIATTMTEADLHETAPEPTTAERVEQSSYYFNELYYLPRPKLSPLQWLRRGIRRRWRRLTGRPASSGCIPLELR